MSPVWFQCVACIACKPGPADPSGKLATKTQWGQLRLVKRPTCWANFPKSLTFTRVFVHSYLPWCCLCCPVFALSNPHKLALPWPKPLDWADMMFSMSLGHSTCTGHVFSISLNVCVYIQSTVGERACLCTTTCRGAAYVVLFLP